MKILIDMNLSVLWVQTLLDEGIEAVHWSSVGESDAPDDEIMQYAADQGYVVFTNDLDFGSILASSGDGTPSVLQLRGQALLPRDGKGSVVAAVRNFGNYLEQGALVTIKAGGARAVLLPLRRD